MYIETSSGSVGDKAELSSYRYFASSPNCKMTLWYHMYGSGVGGLDIKIKKSDGSYDLKTTGLFGNQVGTELAPGVQRADKFIQRVSRYPAD